MLAFILKFSFSSTLNSLSQTINENLEKKYDHLAGLKGLRAKDLRKINNLQGKKMINS